MEILLLRNNSTTESRLTTVREVLLQVQGSAVNIELLERLNAVSLPDAQYGSIVSGEAFETASIHKDSVLNAYVRSLQPGGVLRLQEPLLFLVNEDLSSSSSSLSTFMVSSLRTPESITSQLKMAGLVDVQVTKQRSMTVEEVRNVALSIARPEVVDAILIDSGKVSLFSITAKKPSYKPGASVTLPFLKSRLDSKKTADHLLKKELWKGSAEEDDDELEDEDKLLGGDDLTVPAAKTSADCGTDVKQRKACKNCSCGLAEELDKEAATTAKQQPDTANAKSSCGNCFMGDAFRCASCPYLGMPAFKAGEKVTLDLTDDI